MPSRRKCMNEIDDQINDLPRSGSLSENVIRPKEVNTQIDQNIMNLSREKKLEFKKRDGERAKIDTDGATTK
ncbi:hypothetical protein L1887_05664 [Cichorium endivia]|nr:hypothetical protein L1887_05664 [Cichorium endivia]